MTFQFDTFEKSANSFVSLVRDRSSKDLVSNFSDAIHTALDPRVQRLAPRTFALGRDPILSGERLA